MKHTFAKCIFTSAAFCFALVADAGQTLENSSVSVSVSENGISLLDKKSGKTFAQLPPQYKISKIIKTGETLKFDVAARPPISASITLSQRGFTLSLSADGKFQAPIKFPPAWQMQRGDIGIYPIGTGLALPVEMQCPTRPNPPAIRGAAWSMSLTAFERGGTFVITAIEKPYDAQIFNTLVGGLNHTSIGWLSEKGNFAYTRSLRIFVGDSLASTVSEYRRWRDSQGLVKTLRQKAKTNPLVNKLVGSANFWIWDENFYNQMYRKPENPAAPARNPRKIAEQMLALGITNVLWQNISGETADDCNFLKSRGFLVGKYDIFRDVLPADIAHKIIPARVKMSAQRTKYWPDVVSVDENGEYFKAWKVHGIDGKMYWQHAVCDECAVQMTREIVSADLQKVPYTARLIDVQAGTPPRECYSKTHPTTRRQSSDAIRRQGAYMHSIGQVLGVECGHEFYIASYDYAEGLLSPELARVPDSGRKQTAAHKLSEMPPQTFALMLNPQYRIPLWDLAYHDCAVQYWYWGDTPANCPELIETFDCFNQLYGYPPIYSLDVSRWEQLKEKIAASYHRTQPLAKKVGFAKMIAFDYLNQEKTVQKTTFDNGISVIANFDKTPFTLPDGKKLPPLSTLILESNASDWSIQSNQSKTSN